MLQAPFLGESPRDELISPDCRVTSIARRIADRMYALLGFPLGTHEQMRAGIKTLLEGKMKLPWGPRHATLVLPDNPRAMAMVVERGCTRHSGGGCRVDSDSLPPPQQLLPLLFGETVSPLFFTVLADALVKHEMLHIEVSTPVGDTDTTEYRQLTFDLSTRDLLMINFILASFIGASIWANDEELRKELFLHLAVVMMRDGVPEVPVATDMAHVNIVGLVMMLTHTTEALDLVTRGTGHDRPLFVRRLARKAFELDVCIRHDHDRRFGLSTALQLITADYENTLLHGYLLKFMPNHNSLYVILQRRYTHLDMLMATVCEEAFEYELLVKRLQQAKGMVASEVLSLASAVQTDEASAFDNSTLALYLKYGRPKLVAADKSVFVASLLCGALAIAVTLVKRYHRSA